MAGDRLIGRVLNDRYKISFSYEDKCGRRAYRAYDKDRGSNAVIFPAEGEISSALFSSMRDKAFDLSLLSHPELIRITGCYEDHKSDGTGLRFIVTDSFEGRAFSVIRQERKSREPQAARCTLSAFAAETLLGVLGYVHTNRHRYGLVTPESIYVGKSGRAKMLLLGCIPVFSEEFAKNRRNLFRPYISPEERAGRSPDLQSDIYSAGVFLYEAVMGEVPLFSSAGKLMIPENMKRDVPEGLVQIIVRATESSPAKRYPELGQMAAELRSFQFDDRHVFAHSGRGREKQKTAESILAEQSSRIETLEKSLSEANKKLRCCEEELCKMHELYENERRAHELTREQYAAVMLAMDEDRRRKPAKHSRPEKIELATFYRLDEGEGFV